MAQGRLACNYLLFILVVVAMTKRSHLASPLGLPVWCGHECLGDTLTLSPPKLSRPQKRRRRADRQAVRNAMVNTSALQGELGIRKEDSWRLDNIDSPSAGTQSHIQELHAKIDQIIVFLFSGSTARGDSNNRYETTRENGVCSVGMHSEEFCFSSSGFSFNPVASAFVPCPSKAKSVLVDASAQTEKESICPSEDSTCAAETKVDQTTAPRLSEDVHDSSVVFDMCEPMLHLKLVSEDDVNAIYDAIGSPIRAALQHQGINWRSSSPRMLGLLVSNVWWTTMIC